MKLVVRKNGLLDGDYVEPFAGGAGIAWPLLFGEYVQQVHINDIDSSIYSLWKSILDYTDHFCRLIKDTRVTIAQWHKQKAVQDNPTDCSSLELGFSTFFLNRTNRSGIITGGVIGGKSQNGKWKLDARFNKCDLINRIQRIAKYRSRISLYQLDGKTFIERVLPKLPKQTLVYLDPPYFAKGNDLYQNSFLPDDHVSLAKAIQKRIRQPWLVSYDAVPEISTLYKKRRAIEYKLSYSVQTRYSGSEVMFFSDNLAVPNVPHPVIPKGNRVKNSTLTF